MKSIVNEFEKVSRDGDMPYYIARCKATQGDASASPFNPDGSINVMAMQSRTFKLTKCFFPATEEQCAALEAGIKLGETVVDLELFQINVGHSFNIVKGDEILSEARKVTKVADKQMVVDGKIIKPGESYDTEELVAKVYTEVSLVLFVDANGKSAEGDPEEIARRNFKKGVENGTYIIVD